jgi:hypothetical protein
MSLILVFNKNSPRAHTESELGVGGVHGKLVKYVVHLFKRKKIEKKLFFFTQAAQTAIVATQDRVFPHYVPISSIKHSKSDSKDRSQEIL